MNPDAEPETRLKIGSWRLSKHLGKGMSQWQRKRRRKKEKEKEMKREKFLERERRW